MFLLPIPKGSSTPASPRAAPYHLWLPSSHFHTLNDLREKGGSSTQCCSGQWGLLQTGSLQEEQELERTGEVRRQTESKENGKPPREDQKTSFKAKWALGWAALRSRMEEKLFFLDPGFFSIALLSVLREECAANRSSTSQTPGHLLDQCSAHWRWEPTVSMLKLICLL